MSSGGRRQVGPSLFCITIPYKVSSMESVQVLLVYILCKCIFVLFHFLSELVKMKPSGSLPLNYILNLLYAL